MPHLGDIDLAPKGFCKYDVTGVVYNSAGIGSYFGSDAFNLATTDGVDPVNPAPAAYNDDTITLLVRAGDLDANHTTLTVTGNNARADGHHPVIIGFSPADLGGNPIVSVQADLDGTITLDPNDWVRNVKFLYDLSDSLYYYDAIDWTRDLTVSKPAPIHINLQTYLNSEDLYYPCTGGPPCSATPGPFPHTGGEYNLEITGFAPSNVSSNDLVLNGIDFNTNDLTLPAVSPSQGPWLPSPLLTMNSSSHPTILPQTITYDPLLEVTSGTLNPDYLSISQISEASFTFENFDSNPITDYSFDHQPHFYATSGSGAELMDLEAINRNGLSDVAGRTDPTGAAARYALLSDASNDSVQSNQFHNNAGNFHVPSYLFETSANVNGVYQITELSPSCAAAGICPQVDLDRSDTLGIGALNTGTSDTYAFNFTPAHFFAGQSAGNIAFDLYEYVSYNYADNAFAAAWPVLYPAPTWIQDKEVKSLGIDTSGAVGGQQVYDSVSGRDFTTITTSSSADLRKEIRRNVATLTRNMTACSPATALDSLTTTDSDCVAVDHTNKTVVAYYSKPGDVHHPGRW